jgi:hypothetical protein
MEGIMSLFDKLNAVTEAADNAGFKQAKADRRDPVRRAARAKARSDAHKLAKQTARKLHGA